MHLDIAYAIYRSSLWHVGHAPGVFTNVIIAKFILLDKSINLVANL